jgi:ATP-dependent Lhr-like helicase
LAAFLWAIDQLAQSPLDLDDPTQRCKILYVSPLKALAADVERNLRSPLRGIEQASMRLGEMPREIVVGTRTGDTPQSERRKFAKTPPDILITTPESLFLMLTSGARTGLSGIETVIIDEIHYVAGTKRGAHLALSLERLDHLLQRPARRIGLSATVEPVSAVADQSRSFALESTRPSRLMCRFRFRICLICPQRHCPLVRRTRMRTLFRCRRGHAPRFGRTLKKRSWI